ncbi:hypothetical protein C8J56DRAFT_1012353 [Mycena floridula]|nr:hypothetical protein C8J56DRAFT_1012353 [Mycena floridula]
MSDYSILELYVTGSNAGIGYEAIRILASKGHIVYLAAARNRAAEGTQSQCQSIKAAKDVIEKAEGRLDSLVSDVGFGAIGENQNASTVDLATIRSTFESTSSAAANSYSIALAAELKDEGIKVNCFTPGPIATKLNHFISYGKTPEEGAAMMIPWILLGPEDSDKTGLFYRNAEELAW